MRLIRLPEVLAKVGLGKSALYALISAESFPAPARIGAVRVWSEVEVDAWIDCEHAFTRSNSLSSATSLVLWDGENFV